MSKGLEELKRLAYENACCRCQYYIDKKCTNNYECVWKTIEKELEALEIIKKYLNLSCGQEYIKINVPTGDICICINHDEYKVLEEVLL